MLKSLLYSFFETKFSIRLQSSRFSQQQYQRKAKNVHLSKNSHSRQIKEFWKRIRVDENFIDLYNAINESTEYDVRYLSDDLFYGYVDPFFNSHKVARYLDDKNLYDLFFADVCRPRTIARKINGNLLDSNYVSLTESSVLKACCEEDEIIIKPSVGTEGGKGIVFWNKEMGDSTLMNTINSMRDFIIQKVVKQHNVLRSIHSDSINTIRIITLVRNGTVENLSSVLRMGVGQSRVDNASGGGYFLWNYR